MGREKSLHGKTKNGLQYFIYPQKEFGEKMAAVVVKRGANHIFWKIEEGRELYFPAGTAHFIEHKLFQQEWGDAFTKFLQNRATANAFTDGDKTVYYFTCRDKFVENLKILLDFVNNPYFTKESTEQEKSIITSEIMMYEDDPDWVVYYQMLEGMYENHPIKNKIAGNNFLFVNNQFHLNPSRAKRTRPYSIIYLLCERPHIMHKKSTFHYSVKRASFS